MPVMGQRAVFPRFVRTCMWLPWPGLVYDIVIPDVTNSPQRCDSIQGARCFRGKLSWRARERAAASCHRSFWHAPIQLQLHLCGNSWRHVITTGMQTRPRHSLLVLSSPHFSLPSLAAHEMTVSRSLHPKTKAAFKAEPGGRLHKS